MMNRPRRLPAVVTTVLVSAAIMVAGGVGTASMASAAPAAQTCADRQDPFSDIHEASNKMWLTWYDACFDAGKPVVKYVYKLSRGSKVLDEGITKGQDGRSKKLKLSHGKTRIKLTWYAADGSHRSLNYVTYL